MFDQWVACDRGTFEDDVTAPALSPDMVDDYYYLLKAHATRKLTDDHIWWSVFSRPIRLVSTRSQMAAYYTVLHLRSRFTRVQRVCLCMAMMYLFFLTNAMFYGMTTERLTLSFTNMAFLRFDFTDVRETPLIYLLKLNYSIGLLIIHRL